jgi:hypothetical protein
MFSPYLSDIEHSNKKGYIYLFKILIDNNSFKFGHTTKNIKERLLGYRYHIYDIHYANCSLVKEREYLIKKYLLNDILFNRIQGKEYFSGPFDKIVEVFKYISNLDEENILYYICNKDKCLDITVCNKEKEEEKTINESENETEEDDDTENKDDTENETENEEDNDTENENKTEDEDENKNNKSIKCTICHKEFTSKRYLTIHLKSHVLKFLHQQQIKQKDKEIISTSFEEEKTFNKKQAMYNLKKMNDEDNLYDISNSEAEH